MSGHTPGPWEVVEYGDGDSLAIHEGSSENRICFMSRPGKLGDFEKTKANAILIAAAPDLLEPAPDAADLLERYAEYIRSVPADQLEVHPYLPEVEHVIETLRAAIAKATQEADHADL